MNRKHLEQGPPEGQELLLRGGAQSSIVSPVDGPMRWQMLRFRWNRGN